METYRTPRPLASLAYPLALLALLLTAALALSACGNDETATSTTPPASPRAVETSGDDGSGTALSDDWTRMAVSYSEAPYPPSGKAFAAGTVGWSFKPKVDIEVTALGCFDAFQDGLAHKHRVGIFDAHTGRLIASVTVGPKSALEGAFRWEEIRDKLPDIDGQLWYSCSCLLEGGHAYVVGTRTEPAVEGGPEGEHETLYEEGDPFEEWAPEIEYGGLRTNWGSDTAFSAPTNPRRGFAMVPVAWMSPNFKFRWVGQDPTALGQDPTAW